MIPKRISTLFMVLASLFLGACASTQQSQQLEMGKLTFQSGDYKTAFKTLLPLAADGKPDAQYAVGYMYYYGYGVAMDPTSGEFWMRRAAKQHFGPALIAMKTIDPHTQF